jgi:hypothetical protein
MPASPRRRRLLARAAGPHRRLRALLACGGWCTACPCSWPRGPRPGGGPADANDEFEVARLLVVGRGSAALAIPGITASVHAPRSTGGQILRLLGQIHLSTSLLVGGVDKASWFYALCRGVRGHPAKAMPACGRTAVTPTGATPTLLRVPSLDPSASFGSPCLGLFGVSRWLLGRRRDSEGWGLLGWCVGGWQKLATRGGLAG